MAELHEVQADQFSISASQWIGKDWMLIAAERAGKVNAMTAAWGGIGFMWGKPAVFAVIRPQRFTKEFVDAADTFSLNFFDPSHRETMGYFGKVSGRDEDKIGKTGLTVAHSGATPYFQEVKAAIVCRKLYAQPLKAEFFIDSEPDTTWYPDKDYHTLYIGGVVKILAQDGIGR